MDPINAPRLGQTLHPRLGAAFALIPFTIAAEIAVYAFSEGVDWWGDRTPYDLLIFSPCTVFYLGSLLIWCPVVRWSAWKFIGTLLITAFLTLANVYFASQLVVPVQDVSPYNWMAASLASGAIAIILLNVAWWTPPGERMSGSGMPCPTCGHDMSDAKACRCSQCGSEFTLAELLASHDAVG